jgi:hypothetical protein
MAGVSVAREDDRRPVPASADVVNWNRLDRIAISRPSYD